MTLSAMDGFGEPPVTSGTTAGKALLTYIRSKAMRGLRMKWLAPGAMMFALVLAGCGGGSSTTMTPEPTPQETCEAADGRYNADGTCTSAADLAVEQQHMMVSDAIDAAEAAVAGLSAMSSDAEVSAAEALIAAARTALGGADLLSANQVFVLGGNLSTVEGTLATTKVAIADHRQMVADDEQRMADQRMAANTAIDAANMAVAGLSATSEDADVMAAKDAIQAAKDAVTAATALSMADRDALNSRISTIETTLASTESAIADHRQMVADEQQRTGVSDAIDAAMAAVGDLDAMSTDDEVDAAKALITAAETALSGATSVLTAEQALALSTRISTIKTTLATTETAIAAQRDRDERDAETQRVAAVEAARSEAMDSYMAADADAMKAEDAADMAAATAPGSQGAMAARMAATEARAAANAAKAAHDAIMDGMTKAEADAQAEMAATEAGKANSEYMTAKAENDTIQTAKATQDETQRMSDIADAKTAAGAAVMAAMTAKDNADMAADAAEEARDAAMAAYMMAKAARTDATMAKAEYEKAKAAAMMARDAANAAEVAYMAAKMAADGIMDDGTADAAEMAQMTAETQQGNAEDEAGRAEMQKMAAETAEMASMTAADTHVLTLFLAANGAHVMDDATTPANETEAHVTSVGAAMALIAAAADGAQAGPTATTATATWLGDTVDNPGTEDTDESAEGMFSITVNVAGDTEIVSELRPSRVATDLNDDGDTADPGEAAYTQTARQIADLGVFRGYDLWEDDGDATTTDRARAIVFTDKQKGDDSVLAVTAATARSVVGLEFDNDNVGELSTVTSTGTTITDVTWTPDGEAPLMGTLSCTTGCSITLGANGAVTNIQGYSFTGSRAAREVADAADAAENNDYLAFGLWLDEADNGDDTFGAFAAGGAAAGAPPVALTGTATYSGKAAGAHHMTGEGVNWFDGDADLTANFGDAAAAGTISGMISNIRVAGGAAMSAPIYLGQAELTADTATFNGAAFMGAATAPGASTHEFDGTWSGSFFGPSEAVEADPANNIEAVAAGALAPAAAAGTFGVTKSMGTGDDEIIESFVGAFGAHKD